MDTPETVDQPSNPVAETPAPEVVTLSVALVQGIYDYLATRPFNETAGLIGSILEETKANA